MGYYTRYSLTWHEVMTDYSADISKAIAASETELSMAVDCEGDTVEDCKWYDHEKDMREFSKKFVGVVFILHGVGEGRLDDTPDIWNKYFCDGKMQVCRAKISFDPFNSKLFI